jgi:NAD(P)-dependent dehydrogenase (short-subunit alcohol dehydrogenase family)
MRARRTGAIINVSSIGGQFAAPGSGYYSATKFALEGMSDALRKEVGPLGIKVIVVEPGAFRTDFAGRSLQQSRTAIADYAETAGRRRKENDTTHGHQPGDPARAPQAIIAAVQAAASPFRLLLGSDAVTAIRGELRTRMAEIDAWEPTSLSTDYPS